MSTKYSYSRVGCYTNCPRSFKYRYIDHLKTIEDQNADNALFLGTALHLGLETGDVNGAIEDYKSHFFVINNEIINECMKLEYVIPKALELLPSGLCEEKLDDDYFVGFIDRLVPTYTDKDGIKHFDLYDYKYCAESSVPRYLASGQLSLYKWKYEKLNEGHVIDHLYFLIIPKVKIRQKKTETVQTFRLRLLEELEKTNIRLEEVEYNPEKVDEYFTTISEIEQETEFPKNETRLCDWCQYKNWCMNGDDSDLLIDFENNI
jgi:hypothetical protein